MNMSVICKKNLASIKFRSKTGRLFLILDIKYELKVKKKNHYLKKEHQNINLINKRPNIIKVIIAF